MQTNRSTVIKISSVEDVSILFTSALPCNWQYKEGTDTQRW